MKLRVVIKMEKQYQDFMSINLLGKVDEAKSRGQLQKTFDWDKAAKILKERNVKDASAGLLEDWMYTSGIILEDGKPKKEYTYLSSAWATPVLEIINEDDAEELIECYVEGDCKFDSDTNWPKSSRDIFNS